MLELRVLVFGKALCRVFFYVLYAWTLNKLGHMALAIRGLNLI